MRFSRAAQPDQTSYWLLSDGEENSHGNGARRGPVAKETERRRRHCKGTSYFFSVRHSLDNSIEMEVVDWFFERSTKGVSFVDLLKNYIPQDIRNDCMGYEEESGRIISRNTN